MHYTQLGTSGIKVSQIGFGTRLLRRNMFTTAKEFEELIEAVIHIGINFFVGAGHYSGGDTEKFLGEAIEPYRDKIILATSVGVRHTKENIRISLSVPLIKEQVEQSLKNLHTDYIDVFQLHYYDPTCNMKELYTYLQELSDSGIFRVFGVSNFRLQELKTWEGIPIQSLQMPYNPLQREIEEKYVGLCEEKHISLLTYMPLCGGIFTDKNVGAKNLSPYEEYLPPEKVHIIKTFLGELDVLAKKLTMTISDLVLLWLVNKPFITAILLGTSNIEHLQANISAITKKVSLPELNLLDHVFNTFWSHFPQGITIPFTVEKIIELSPGRRYTDFYGNYIPLPGVIQKGDTVIINDTLGEIIS